MRVAAGFPREAGFSNLKRAFEPPPQSLRNLLWPWVDKALEQYARKQISRPDRAGLQFLKLMVKLRDVFLQDSAVLQAHFPDNPFWENAIFKHEDWPAFAQRVRECEM